MNMKKIASAILAGAMILSFAACGEMMPVEPGPQPEKTVTETALRVTSEDVYKAYPDASVLVLAETSAKLNDVQVEAFDYTWHADPSKVHDEVKNCPAEYYTGTKPETDAAVYIARDILYYPALPEEGFKKVRYDGETEYAYYYTDGENGDFIFATLPVLGNAFPAEMMHTEEEAAANPVLHITKAGTYILEGSWKGQILVDLGDEDDIFADETAKVTLVFNGVSVECSVAPSLIFKSVYECDNAWEERESHTETVDTSNAGAVVVIADSTVNNFTGANVFRMLKTKYKDEDSKDEIKVQKKAHKTDGAFYSYMSMNINGGELGTGVLNIRSTTFEGLDCELHLTVNGGNVNIKSQDDGINVNEDDVSVVTFNGGTTVITAGLGAEGDGVDSNGYIVVNGGTVIAAASPISDNGLDSSSGTKINGGTVIALGSNMGGSSYTVYVDGAMQYGSRVPDEGFGPGGQEGQFDPGRRDDGQGGFDPRGQGGEFDPGKFGPGGQQGDMPQPPDIPQAR